MSAHVLIPFLTLFEKQETLHFAVARPINAPGTESHGSLVLCKAPSASAPYFVESDHGYAHAKLQTRPLVAEPAWALEGEGEQHDLPGAAIAALKAAGREVVPDSTARAYEQAEGRRTRRAQRDQQAAARAQGWGFGLALAPQGTPAQPGQPVAPVDTQVELATLRARVQELEMKQEMDALRARVAELEREKAEEAEAEAAIAAHIAELEKANAELAEGVEELETKTSVQAKELAALAELREQLEADLAAATAPAPKRASGGKGRK